PDLVLDLPELAPDRTDGTPDERERRVGPREAADTAGRLCRPHLVVAGLGGNDLHAGAGALVGDVGDAVAVGADGEFRPLGGRAGDADVGDVLQVLGTPVLVQVEALERHLWARVGRDDVRAVPHGRDPVEAAVRRRRDGQAHVLAGLDVADDEGGTGLGDADDPPRRGLLLVRGDLGLALLGGALVLAHHVDARADGQRHGGRDADRDESLPRPETRVRGWVLAPVVHGDA